MKKLICLGPTRADFAEKLEKLIESYNADSRNIETRVSPQTPSLDILGLNSWFRTCGSAGSFD